MTDYSFPRIFTRQFRYWVLHCTLNALPSLAIALGWLGLWQHPDAILAMLSAIFSFVILYSTLTSIKGPISNDGHALHRAMKLGAKIRGWISGLSLIFVAFPGWAVLTPDFWCGWLAIESLNTAAKHLGASGIFFDVGSPGRSATFGKIYVTTMLEGFILSLLLMTISFFCVLFIQSRDRRRRFSAAN